MTDARPLLGDLDAIAAKLRGDLAARVDALDATLSLRRLVAAAQDRTGRTISSVDDLDLTPDELARAEVASLTLRMQKGTPA